MSVNAKRYWDLMQQLSQITDPNHPYTRRSFSELFLQGRDWLQQKMQLLGLTTHIDPAGNLIGRLVGRVPTLPVIMIGSHSDTVPNGGRFDGIAGVIAGLELVATLQETGNPLNHSLEIVDFLAEEPSEWGISCIGSRGISGALSDEILHLSHPGTKELLIDAIRRMGGNPEQCTVRNDIAAFFELHIEQGNKLAAEQRAIGVVSGIVGIVRLHLSLQGHAAHAGTTPMHLRQDPLIAAAEIIQWVNQHAVTLSNRGTELVATCGQLFLSPNACNVIPGQCDLVFDIRAENNELLQQFIHRLSLMTEEISENHRVNCTRFERKTSTAPSHFDAKLMQHVIQSCHNRQLSYQVMPSGAGHDASFLTRIAPSAMIFVPSKAGKSHCPEEWTSPAELAQGVAVLLDTITAFDALHSE